MTGFNACSVFSRTLPKQLKKYFFDALIIITDLCTVIGYIKETFMIDKKIFDDSILMKCATMDAENFKQN